MKKLDELRKIKTLLDDGFINKEEFQVLKNEILGIKEPKSNIIETIDDSNETETNNIDEIPLKPKLESKKNKESKQENDSNNNEQKPSINKKPPKEDTGIEELKESSKREMTNFPKWLELILVLIIPLVLWLTLRNYN
ncbi:SHOCT domain-containing protein [Lutibacter sp. HS1-25]|uniref:SHOCT domain-containing protein n=1 Tax=Lutibacter sp. HS1-25 TaxID=2485000 RepID=UPI0010105C72|nr:SHOCT domain-containing protein [Lutibacter sp. HS1-25]RXP64556.1 SHOCT domain-containing protein [Lutibacter sp. HS1-25]